MTDLAQRLKTPSGGTPAHDIELSLLRAALQEQGKLLGQLHEMMSNLNSQVETIKHHLGV